MLKRLEKETGIRCNAHSIRCGFATALRRAGVGELDIQQLGRWSSLEMVRRYTKAFTFDDAAERYKPIVTWWGRGPGLFETWPITLTCKYSHSGLTQNKCSKLSILWRTVNAALVPIHLNNIIIFIYKYSYQHPHSMAENWKVPTIHTISYCGCYCMST